MQSEIGSNETCARGCPRIQAQDCVGHTSKEIRFEWEREGGWVRGGWLRLNGASTRVTFIGRMRVTIWSAGGKDCGGWFAGRLHNAILRHNDCNALMHFRTVHWIACDWRCFESLFSRLHGSGLACILIIPLPLRFGLHEQDLFKSKQSEYHNLRYRHYPLSLETIQAFALLYLAAVYIVFSFSYFYVLHKFRYIVNSTT